MAELVQRVLEAAAEKEAKYKTTEVEKDIDLEIDEGNLLAIDTNPLDLKEFRSNKDAYLTSLARGNTQLLLNKIWELPVEQVEDIVTAKLPDPKTILPREKRIPKVKPQTKWQQYATMKGIQNKKRGRMVWDDQSKEWKPRWGYKRGGDETKDWMLEVPATADPYEDQFEKKLKAKKERVAKNELQRLRNIARNMKGKVPGVGLTPIEKPDKDHLSRALTAATKSTASVGKFTNQLPKEKPAKRTGRKRKFEPTTGDMAREKKQALDILHKVSSGAPTLDVTKAVNQHMAAEDQQGGGAAGRGRGNKTPSKGRRSKGGEGQGKAHKGQKQGGKKGRRKVRR